MIDKRDGRSSYLQYLPPVLWENGVAGSALDPGAMLKIFEKILTGIDDGLPIQHGTRDYQSIQGIIADLPKLFNPWYTPPEFLAWLASWVALELPGTGIWDDYQQRKAISQIVQVYRQRGLKAGLNQYLDLYTLSEKQPRIAIDDSNALLFAWPAKNRLAPIYASGLPGPYVGYNENSQEHILFEEGLVRPSCIARAVDGSLFIGDAGTPTSWVPPIEPGVWRVSPLDQATVSGPPTRPERLRPRDEEVPNRWKPTSQLVAVVLDQEEATPDYLYVLDGVMTNTATALYILRDPLASTEPELVATVSKADLGLIYPIAMALDPRTGHLLILDRGTTIFSEPYKTKPAIIDVNVQANPITYEKHPILPEGAVKEPLSLLVTAEGDLIIGDAQKQNDRLAPATLVRIQRPVWSAQPLLANLSSQQNPLVAPCALVQMDRTHILVLDIGLRPYLPIFSNTAIYIRQIAEPAALYLIDVSNQEQPVITPASESRQLVFPTAMVFHQGLLAICDKGDYALGKDPEKKYDRVWRVLPHEFGITIHFSERRGLPTRRERRQIGQNISAIIAQEKPAHVLATMAYPIDE